MADEEQVALLKARVDKWNAWRQKNPRIVPNLVGADLIGANLGLANLRGANLRGAHLVTAHLRRANIRGANLNSANLAAANLSGANLRSANLSWANLRGVYLDHTIVAHADFTDSMAGLTIFADIDLSLTIGLEKVFHNGPSTIGIDTLYRSNGQIPEAFLRGAGVPDTLITFAKSLVANPIEFYSCFISYSTKDQPFADRLHADLQANGVRCWFAPHDAQRGRKLHEQIDEAIRVHDKLLLILSHDSMSSDWVKTEITRARKRELEEKTQVLFPLGLAPFENIRRWEFFDADTGTDTAREIRQYLIPDFAAWKDHDAYQREFELLLRDLKLGRRPK